MSKKHTAMIRSTIIVQNEFPLYKCLFYYVTYIHFVLCGQFFCIVAGFIILYIMIISSLCSTSQWLVHFQNCSQPTSFLPSQRAPITSWVRSPLTPSSPETSETSGPPSSTSTSLVIKNGRLHYMGLLCEQCNGL